MAGALRVRPRVWIGLAVYVGYAVVVFAAQSLADVPYDELGDSGYANRMDMSKAGIYSQLTAESGENLSPESAQYAVDNVTADWTANALATAKLFQETDLAPADIHDYLISETGGQFTQEEADYAMEHLNDEPRT